MKTIDIYLLAIAITVIIQTIICVKSNDIIVNTAIPIISLIIYVYTHASLEKSTGYDINYYRLVNNMFAFVLLTSIVPLITKLIIKLENKKRGKINGH